MSGDENKGKKLVKNVPVSLAHLVPTFLSHLLKICISVSGFGNSVIVQQKKSLDFSCGRN